MNNSSNKLRGSMYTNGYKEEDSLEMHKKLLSVVDKDVETMTDEDIEAVAQIFGENISDTEKMLRELPGNDASILRVQPEFLRKSIQESKDMYDGVPMDATVYIDPITGNRDIMMGIEKRSDITMRDLADGKTVSDTEALELIKNNLSEYGDDVGIEDAQEIFNFIGDMEKGNIKDGDEYLRLPKLVKREITEMEAQNGIILPKEARNGFARDFYETMKQSIYIDQELIDLEEAIQKELDFDILDQYLDNIVDVMENEILRTADKFEEEGDSDRATVFRNMSSAFTRSYSYERLLNKIKNKSGVINRDMTRELKKFDDKCKRFNRTYKSTNFIIPDIRILAPILDRLMPEEVHIDDIKKFILLMINEFLRMNPDSVVDHTEMYYSIKIIESLDYVGSEDSKMRTVVLDNISKVINEIKEN